MVNLLVSAAFGLNRLIHRFLCFIARSDPKSHATFRERALGNAWLFLRVLWRDCRAVSAIEFALLLPFMLLLFAGSVEFGDALAVDRKVNRLASTIADLTAQRLTMNQAEMQNIFAAAGAILEPYPTATLSMTVMAVSVDSPTVSHIVWAETIGGIDPPNGSPPPLAIPAEIATSGTDIIVGQADYRFHSRFSSFLAPITGQTDYRFSHVFFMRPRLGTSIPWE